MNGPLHFKVAQIFHFSDDQVTLVGTDEGDAKCLKAGRYDLFVDGRKTASLDIEGEMIPVPRINITHRALTTRNIAPLKDISTENHVIELILPATT